MEQVTERKKTGRHVPNALTSSKRKNQSLGRTRRKREKAQQAESTKLNSRKKFIIKPK